MMVMVTVQFVRTPPIHQVWMVVDEIDQLNQLGIECTHDLRIEHKMHEANAVH